MTVTAPALVTSYSCLLFVRFEVSLLVERQALAVRLDLCFRSVYLFFYPGISFEPLNLYQQKFAR